MPLMTMREWDIKEGEAKLRVIKVYRTWLEGLLGGRNPLENMVSMSFVELNKLGSAPPPQVAPQGPTPVGPEGPVGAPPIEPPTEEL